jgi:outer membrane protein OmpA-like peptidoglycan-associated protein
MTVCVFTLHHSAREEMRHFKTMRFAALIILGLGMSGPARSMSCTPGPFIIFFESGNAYVDDEALKILESVRQMAGTCGYMRTMLSGYTDTEEDQKLARKRVDIVRAYLGAHGIPRSDIIVRAFGAKQQRIRTGPNVSERQNRRVEIIFGPMP